MFFKKSKFDSSLNEEVFISNEIEKIILNSIKKNGNCKICVSGGSSPVKTLTELSKSDKIDWSKAIFFLTDERITVLTDNESNYGNIKSIFKNFPITIEPFYDGIDTDKSIIGYQKYLKEYLENEKQCFDLLILGFGEDGHIASLFPDDISHIEKKKDIIHLNKIIKGFDRLSLSMKRLKKSKQTVIISYGQTKHDIAKDYKKYKYPISEFLIDQENVIWFYSV